MRGHTIAYAADLLRDLIGNPFRPLAPFDPCMLRWNSGTIVRLAQQAYDDRLLPSGHLDPRRLAVLGDAIEEAGFTSDAILAHYRQQGAVHVRGCFLLDAILGKELPRVGNSGIAQGRRS